jgi:hypothetical protein
MSIRTPSSSGRQSPSSPDSLSSLGLELDPSTLSLLDDFLTSRADGERRFNELEEAARAYDSGEESENEEGKTKQKMMSVDEYRLAFGEDWQLSQFWLVSACVLCFHILISVRDAVRRSARACISENLHPRVNHRVLVLSNGICRVPTPRSDFIKKTGLVKKL